MIPELSIFGWIGIGFLIGGTVYSVLVLIGFAYLKYTGETVDWEELEDL